LYKTFVNFMNTDRLLITYLKYYFVTSSLKIVFDKATKLFIIFFNFYNKSK